MLKWVIGLGTVLVLAAAGGVGLAVHYGLVDGAGGSLRRAEPELEVRIEPVWRGGLTRVVSAPGAVEPRTRVQVSARVSSRITALPLEEGSPVREGDVVVRLDAEDLEARLEGALSRLEAEEARLAGARASMTLAELELGRMRELHESGDVPRSELDRAAAQYEQAAAAVRAGDATLRMLRSEITERRKDVDNAVITSPINGTITRVNLQVGEQVLGTLTNPGTVIMEIADLRNMLVRTRVDETNVASVREGHGAEVYITAHPGRVFEGVVERVRYQRELHRDGTSYVEAEVKLKLEEEDLLQTGLTANVDIRVQTIEGALLVPLQAVLDRRVEDLPAEVVAASEHTSRDRTYAQVVFVVRGGKAEAVPVSVGASDQTHAVATGGLEEGWRIVTGPYRVLATIKHGDRVKDAGAGEAEEEFNSGA